MAQQTPTAAQKPQLIGRDVVVSVFFSSISFGLPTSGSPLWSMVLLFSSILFIATFSGAPPAGFRRRRPESPDVSRSPKRKKIATVRNRKTRRVAGEGGGGGRGP